MRVRKSQDPWSSSLRADCRGMSEIQWRWVVDRRPGVSHAVDIDEVAMVRFKSWAEGTVGDVGED